MTERGDYGDILLVNTIDIYRHLPLKLLQCHQWYEKNYDVDSIMKTDDDCYVDIEQIFEKLQEFKNQNKTWWGNFRSEWMVERHGKWKERDYTASVYPKFACGSGNVISSDIHKWLVKNNNDLNLFQGEDVSMGIWLSSLVVKYVQNDSLMCNKTCMIESPPLVVPEIDIMELKAFWKNKLKCNNPCLCK
ncbi:hypothetical protein LOTGIDRAFT_111084 [Lottia gigantea]|uniref:Hexosyltransferase n=1 Tax=Lottia gigantea TaxID=225164 RepID=V4BA64_LOTGI|nr:hypothetical protein LOTGIDRAFT_111084 [Lottia gigantea]ESP02802.1 hypothetical protein LOTGIDRAFT_111084 [Lottia gigantea]